jgi:hypothetical protein
MQQTMLSKIAWEWRSLRGMQSGRLGPTISGTGGASKFKFPNSTLNKPIIVDLLAALFVVEGEIIEA